MPTDSKGRFVSAETKPLRERFYEKVNKTDSCWLWTGYLNKGYGYIHVRLGKGKRPRPAYRVVWELENGDIPEGLHVRHKCKNKHCVNPEHLELGTAKENAKDRKRDGTEINGEKNGSSKLSENDVLTILSNWFPCAGYDWEYCVRVASEYDVRPLTIYEIIKGKTWKHLQ